MTTSNDTPITELLALMKQLRDPERGCAWDRAQSFDTIVKHTLEETYELVEAVHKKDWPNLKEELGDLLMQITYYTQIATEQNLFTFDDVARGIVEKIKRRYRHIFGDEVARTPEEVAILWEKVKAEERKNKPQPKEGPVSYKFGSAVGPALTRAATAAKRAEADNLHSLTPELVAAKVKEELAEVISATSATHRQEELGDLLFAVVSLCRKYEVNPESALHSATNKFVARWQSMYDMAKSEGTPLAETKPERIHELWVKAKGKVENSSL